jgi:hypothetical protein
MLKQERFLNEFRANPSTIIKPKNLLGLERFGVVAIGEGNINNDFDEISIDELDEDIVKLIPKFVKECKKENIRFKNACLEIDRGYEAISLYNSSVVLNGNFNHTINLNHRCCIKNGKFNKLIGLFGKSYIKGGEFNSIVELFEESYIKGGIFNRGVSLFQDSFILDGYFNLSILLHENTKIKGGSFHNRLEVVLNNGSNKWVKDVDTWNFLNKNRINYVRGDI